MAPELSARQQGDAIVLRRNNQMHAEHDWCDLCRQEGPCIMWRITRAALEQLKVVAPGRALARWSTPLPGRD
jgi:hypothetical protein